MAPLPKYDYGQGRGDYEDYRGQQLQQLQQQHQQQQKGLVHGGGEVEDPYARVLYRNSRMPNSQSGSRLHHQGEWYSIDRTIIYSGIVKYAAPKVFFQNFWLINFGDFY